MAKQRIEYIDAMRGFTMILVVYSHICNFCLGDMWTGWNDVFYLFRGLEEKAVRLIRAEA